MSLSFLDPDDEAMALGPTQGDEFRFDFTIPSQNPTLSTQDITARNAFQVNNKQ